MQGVLRTISNLVVKNKQLYRNAVNVTSVGAVIENDKLKSWKEIPGPSSLPVIGQGHHFLPGGSFHKLDILELMEQLYKSFGKVVRLDGIIGIEPTIILFDPESGSKILREENNLPLRRGFESLKYFREGMRKPSEKTYGLLTAQGQPWKDIRSAVNPVMLDSKVIKSYETKLAEVSQDMIERIRSFKDDQNRIKDHFGYEISLWSLESIGVVALGRRVGCLKPNLSENSIEKQMIISATKVLHIMEKSDLQPNLWKYIWTPTFTKAMRLYKGHETLTKTIIDQSVLEFKNKRNANTEKGILEKIMAINENIAYSISTDMLLAGIDTVYHAILSSLYLLSINPEKQHKLREALKTDKQKKYLKATIKESLRLIPVPLLSIRKTNKEYNLLEYKIPRGIHIAFMHQISSSLDELAFTRSKEFIPERWLTGKEDPLSYKHGHPFAYNPFGYGTRSCIGRRIAELEMQLFLEKFVQNFHIEWSGPIKKKSFFLHKRPFNFVINDIKQ